MSAELPSDVSAPLPQALVGGPFEQEVEQLWRKLGNGRPRGTDGTPVEAFARIVGAYRAVAPDLLQEAADYWRSRRAESPADPTTAPGAPPPYNYVDEYAAAARMTQDQRGNAQGLLTYIAGPLATRIEELANQGVATRAELCSLAYTPLAALPNLPAVADVAVDLARYLHLDRTVLEQSRAITYLTTAMEVAGLCSLSTANSPLPALVAYHLPLVRLQASLDNSWSGSARAKALESASNACHLMVTLIVPAAATLTAHKVASDLIQISAITAERAGRSQPIDVAEAVAHELGLGEVAVDDALTVLESLATASAQIHDPPYGLVLRAVGGVAATFLEDPAAAQGYFLDAARTEDVRSRVMLSALALYWALDGLAETTAVAGTTEQSSGPSTPVDPAALELSQVGVEAAVLLSEALHALRVPGHASEAQTALARSVARLARIAGVAGTEAADRIRAASTMFRVRGRATVGELRRHLLEAIVEQVRHEDIGPPWNVHRVTARAVVASFATSPFAEALDEIRRDAVDLARRRAQPIDEFRRRYEPYVDPDSRFGRAPFQVAGMADDDALERLERDFDEDTDLPLLLREIPTRLGYRNVMGSRS